MKKPQKKIINPMSIIAIFATLSETSAAVSLPFLDEDDREIYIWFLISFPFYLLFLFFYTLNFNYKSLYAPSDFQKSKQFIKVIDDTARSETNRGTNLAKMDKQTLQAPAKKEHVERSNKRRRAELYARSDYLPPSMQDPPGIAASDYLSAQHQISLPKSIQTIRIMDARWIRKKKELRHLAAGVNEREQNHRKAIILLSCHDSAHIVNGNSFKETSTKTPTLTNGFYMIYNLSTQAVTVIDQDSNSPDYPSEEKSRQNNAREKEDRKISEH
ncbi:hypothetical protein [Pseudomonas sp. FW300-N1A1]|uniref:hypothetical protein n=1 Tax=Pseudomonas sp. FW300-N1A1 TaxID=2075555 RepID=UPI002114F61C|nr:hypothetical protein [Pseudomonas sp. FW300-N1A1]